MKRIALIVGLTVLGAAPVGCADESEGPSQESDLTSKSHTFLDLSFSGTVVAPHTDSAEQLKKSVVTQLFYMSGELDKVHGGHGRFGFVELTNVTTEPVDDTLDRTTYEATVQVAWPKYSSVPETYRVVVPMRVDDDGLRAFNGKYSGSCGEAHYGSDALWYDFEPVTSGCAMDAADILDTVATVRASDHVNETHYPEYPRFWEDGEFRVVIVHGTDSAWSKDPSDVGVAEYLDLQDILTRELPEGQVVTGETSSSIWDDWEISATVPAYGGGEGRIVVNTLLTSSLSSIGADFDARYDALSRTADLVMYGGHSGLSKNIKALAAKGVVEAGHYQVFFLDGCSTFAYLDSTMADRRREVNGADADPEGTKFLEVIVNAQPVPWYPGSTNLWHMIKNFGGTEAHTYWDIVSTMPQAGSPVAAGEEDNPTEAP